MRLKTVRAHHIVGCAFALLPPNVSLFQENDASISKVPTRYMDIPGAYILGVQPYIYLEDNTDYYIQLHEHVVVAAIKASVPFDRDEYYQPVVQGDGVESNS